MGLRTARGEIAEAAKTLRTNDCGSGYFECMKRAGSLLGLGSAERWLRLSLVELAPGGSNADPDTVVLPPKLERLLHDIRNRLSGASVQPTPV